MFIWISTRILASAATWNFVSYMLFYMLECGRQFFHKYDHMQQLWLFLSLVFVEVCATQLSTVHVLSTKCKYDLPVDD